MSALIDDYLTHLRLERRLADLSIESYGRDLSELYRFAAARGKPVELAQIAPVTLDAEIGETALEPEMCEVVVNERAHLLSDYMLVSRFVSSAVRSSVRCPHARSGKVSPPRPLIRSVSESTSYLPRASSTSCSPRIARCLRPCSVNANASRSALTCSRKPCGRADASSLSAPERAAAWAFSNQRRCRRRSERARRWSKRSWPAGKGPSSRQRRDPRTITRRARDRSSGYSRPGRMSSSACPPAE